MNIFRRKCFSSQMWKIELKFEPNHFFFSKIWNHQQNSHLTAFVRTRTSNLPAFAASYTAKITNVCSTMRFYRINSHIVFCFPARKKTIHANSHRAPKTTNICMFTAGIKCGIVDDDIVIIFISKRIHRYATAWKVFLVRYFNTILFECPRVCVCMCVGTFLHIFI